MLLRGFNGETFAQDAADLESVVRCAREQDGPSTLKLTGDAPVQYEGPNYAYAGVMQLDFEDTEDTDVECEPWPCGVFS